MCEQSLHLHVLQCVHWKKRRRSVFLRLKSQCCRSSQQDFNKAGKHCDVTTRHLASDCRVTGRWSSLWEITAVQHQVIFVACMRARLRSSPLRQSPNSRINTHTHTHTKTTSCLLIQFGAGKHGLHHSVSFRVGFFFQLIQFTDKITTKWLKLSEVKLVKTVWSWYDTIM